MVRGVRSPGSAERRPPTITDVAARAGVSKGAVSFALNGSAGVSEETRAKIVAAAEEIGFRPNRAARSLSRARTEVIGLVLNRPMRTLGVEPFFGQLSAGISTELAANGHSLQTFTVHSVADELEVYRRWWHEQRVDALVIMDPVPRDRRISLVREVGMPAVVIGAPSVAGRLSHVWADDAHGMQQCLEHLVSLGHRRIGHVGGTPSYAHTRRRTAVLTDALDAGRFASLATVTTDFSDTAAAEATRELLDLPVGDRVTGIIYDSDVMALAGMRALQEAGVSAPEQVSVLSFDDSLLTRLTHPPLTALSRDTFDFGVLVGRAVIATLADPEHVVSVEAAQPTLVVRDSTGPAPRRGVARRSAHRRSGAQETP
ncbi:MAG: LacI family transcriptional regulator [Propionibacteriales bacterium]|nr:LacI family transcriptional regulator [Propionibacteriales bacterium]